jgi:hypothetical protein
MRSHESTGIDRQIGLDFEDNNELLQSKAQFPIVRIDPRPESKSKSSFAGLSGSYFVSVAISLTPILRKVGRQSFAKKDDRRRSVSD